MKKDEDNTGQSRGRPSKKEELESSTTPRDSVMAIIYATKALEIEQRWG